LKELLRPDMPASMDHTRGENGSEALDGDSELKMVDEADLAMEGSYVGTGTQVPVKVSSFET
jgi:hypothetical protein